MKANPLDLLQIHNLMDWQIHLKTLRNLKEKQVIRYIGVTHYHPGGYDEMERIIKNESIDFIQINYNLAAREAGQRILPLAQDKGLAVIINRPYQGGSLFRKCKGKTLPVWAAEFEANSWAQFFLKFVLANQAVVCTIPGTTNPKHMAENAQTGSSILPDQKQQTKMIELINSL